MSLGRTDWIPLPKWEGGGDLEGRGEEDGNIVRKDLILEGRDVSTSQSLPTSPKGVTVETS